MHFGIDDFFKFLFKKVLQNRRFSALASRSLVLELQIAAIGGAVVRKSIALSNSVSADRNGMAAPRFLAAAAASVTIAPGKYFVQATL